MNQSLSKLIAENGVARVKGLNQGLFHGNMGLSLLLYAGSKSQADKRTEEIADGLLDEVFNSISTTITPDFENGSVGIAWGIEYLLRNGYAEGESDHILENLDHRLFSWLNDNKLVGFEFTSGLSGALMYLSLRLQDYPDNPSLSLRINRELFIHCINQIDDAVSSQLNAISKDLEFDLFWRVPLVFLCLLNARNTNIYEEKIQRMITQWIPTLESGLPGLHINRIYLAIAVYRVGLTMQKKELVKLSKTLLFSVEIDQLRTEINFGTDRIRYGYNGFLWVLKNTLQLFPANFPQMNELRPFVAEMEQKAADRNNHSVNSLTSEKLMAFDVCEHPLGIELWELMVGPLFHPAKVPSNS